VLKLARAAASATGASSARTVRETKGSGLVRGSPRRAEFCPGVSSRGLVARGRLAASKGELVPPRLWGLGGERASSNNALSSSLPL